MTALVSCCLPAAGVRFWGILSRPGLPPLSRSACRTVHRAARTRAGFPCSARVRHSWGRVPSLPRGLRCLPRPGAIPGRRAPPHHGRSLSPRCCLPSRGVPNNGASARVHWRSPFPAFSLACDPRTERESLGFSLSFAPGRARPSRAHQGGNEPQALPGVTSSAR